MHYSHGFINHPSAYCIASHSILHAPYTLLQAFPRPVDPRTIPFSLIHDINSTQRRIVRLLNVNTNHYQIHLPTVNSSCMEVEVDVDAQAFC